MKKTNEYKAPGIKDLIKGNFKKFIASVTAMALGSTVLGWKIIASDKDDIKEKESVSYTDGLEEDNKASNRAFGVGINQIEVNDSETIVVVEPTEIETESIEVKTEPTELETESMEVKTEPTELETESIEAKTEPTELETESIEVKTEPTELETESIEAEKELTELETKTAEQIESTEKTVDVIKEYKNRLNETQTSMNSTQHGPFLPISNSNKNTSPRNHFNNIIKSTSGNRVISTSNEQEKSQEVLAQEEELKNNELYQAFKVISEVGLNVRQGPNVSEDKISAVNYEDIIYVETDKIKAYNGGLWGPAKYYNYDTKSFQTGYLCLEEEFVEKYDEEKNSNDENKKTNNNDYEINMFLGDSTEKLYYYLLEMEGGVDGSSKEYYIGTNKNKDNPGGCVTVGPGLLMDEDKVEMYIEKGGKYTDGMNRKEGSKWDKEIILEMYKEYVEESYNVVMRKLGNYEVKVSELEKIALTCAVYQLGSNSPYFNDRITMMKSGATADELIGNWVRAYYNQEGKELIGVRSRRYAEWYLYKNGIFIPPYSNSVKGVKDVEFKFPSDTPYSDFLEEEFAYKNEIEGDRDDR